MQQKFDGFLDNLIWVGNGKFSLLLREYAQFPGNMLSTSPKIWNMIENNFF